MSSFEMHPIGYVHCSQYYRYQQPRQSCFADNEGRIILERKQGFEQALQNISGFSHIWVVYVFHLNETWNPMVSPPVNPDGRKKGVFATRAPHRPNRIGFSAVRLLHADPSRRSLGIADFDMLDKTPVLDIKPYIPAADSFPTASGGWVPTEQELYRIVAEKYFEEQAAWVFAETGYDLTEFARVQLCLDPRNAKRKRITLVDPVGERRRIAFRTWSVIYSIDEVGRTVVLHGVTSNYTAQERADSPDIYGDREIHRRFTALYAGGPD
ncbi:MAG: tRNA (N6-threonylcarbamoyladenosine(37)-N6)-methyltransferase TrmO [Fibrobacterota bacterium]